MPLMHADDSALLIIDAQARLAPAIHEGERAVARMAILAEAAGALGVPILRTEQYPQGLGPTVEALAGAGLGIAKMSFDACAEPDFLAALPPDLGLVLCGFEAHVCVAQTAISLRAAGRSVRVVADAVGSRLPESKAAGLSRMERHGTEIVTSEMVVFEWLGSAQNPQFKALSRLIR